MTRNIDANAQLLPNLATGQFMLAVLPHGSTKPVLNLAARQSQHAPLRVLDGGNRFNAYVVAQTLRQQTTDVESALKRIYIARAFTCYQVVTLLHETLAAPLPTLVLDLLATFRDESVSLEERYRLLHTCTIQLNRLADQAPLLVSVTPQGTGVDELLDLLEKSADQVWRFDPTPAALPLRLF
ncbi:MAG: hypothetical protein PVF74_09070 [Anaerolineales bacterium]|jgi:hypothetical protein